MQSEVEWRMTLKTTKATSPLKGLSQIRQRRAGSWEAVVRRDSRGADDGSALAAGRRWPDRPDSRLPRRPSRCRDQVRPPPASRCPRQRRHPACNRSVRLGHRILRRNAPFNGKNQHHRRSRTEIFWPAAAAAEPVCARHRGPRRYGKAWRLAAEAARLAADRTASSFSGSTGRG